MLIQEVAEAVDGVKGSKLDKTDDLIHALDAAVVHGRNKRLGIVNTREML